MHNANVQLSTTTTLRLFHKLRIVGYMYLYTRYNTIIIINLRHGYLDTTIKISMDVVA